jgi:hypothetical protein
MAGYDYNARDGRVDVDYLAKPVKASAVLVPPCICQACDQQIHDHKSAGLTLLLGFLALSCDGEEQHKSVDRLGKHGQKFLQLTAKRISLAKAACNMHVWKQVEKLILSHRTEIGVIGIRPSCQFKEPS